MSLGIPIPLALSCALSLAAVALSAFTLYYAGASARAAWRHAREVEDRVQSLLETARLQVEALAAKLEQLEQEPKVNVLPGLPRPGMNLATRSQVLRMHRHGETAPHIAAALQIPRQEVELLLKIHKIGLSA